MKIILGFVIGIIILPLCGFFYIWLGYAPVATAGPPLPLERTITSMALHARIKREAPQQVPIPDSEENLMAGARTYHDVCAACHGLGGDHPEPPLARGMYPHPPQLLHGKGVTDDPVGVTYWKVANGIRLTGMPAFDHSLDSTQMWQVSLFLAKANQLPAPAKKLVDSGPEPK
jgi:thiosulfate dehydrogenase